MYFKSSRQQLLTLPFYLGFGEEADQETRPKAGVCISWQHAHALPGFDPQHIINWACGSSLQPQQNTAGGPESQGRLGIVASVRRAWDTQINVNKKLDLYPECGLAQGRTHNSPHQYERGRGGGQRRHDAFFWTQRRSRPMSQRA